MSVQTVGTCKPRAKTMINELLQIIQSKIDMTKAQILLRVRENSESLHNEDVRDQRASVVLLDGEVQHNFAQRKHDEET